MIIKIVNMTSKEPVTYKRSKLKGGDSSDIFCHGSVLIEQSFSDSM